MGHLALLKQSYLLSVFFLIHCPACFDCWQPWLPLLWCLYNGEGGGGLLHLSLAATTAPATTTLQKKGTEEERAFRGRDVKRALWNIYKKNPEFLHSRMVWCVCVFLLDPLQDYEDSAFLCNFAVLTFFSSFLVKWKDAVKMLRNSPLPFYNLAAMPPHTAWMDAATSPPPHKFVVKRRWEEEEAAKKRGGWGDWTANIFNRKGWKGRLY